MSPFVPRSTDRGPIVFEHYVQDFEPRRDGEFHEVRARIDKEIHER